LVQSGHDAAVDDLVTDADDEPAADGCVDGVTHLDAAAVELAELVGESALLLRIQLERQKESFFPSIREYATAYQINREILKSAKPDVLIMHPGPVNRGVEITSEIVDGPSSMILDQVTNGLAVRMAVLFLLSGSSQEGVKEIE